MSNLETVKPKKSKRKWLIGIGILFVLSFVYSMGSGTASTEIDGQKVTYDALTEQIANKEAELNEVTTQLDELNKEYESNKAKFDEAMTIVNDKEKAIAELDELNQQIKVKEGRISELSNKVSTLDTKVREVKSQPKNLSAGQFVVGRDLPSGRYKVVATGQMGNFIVYGGNGGLKVNTILGDGFESQYVFYAEEGDVMELATSMKFTPVN